TIAGIKLAMYNKSYINFKCLLTAIYDAQEADRATLDETKLEDCAKGPLSQWYMSYKIFIDYHKAIEPMIAKRCKMHARLFGDEPELFDFEKWHECLLGRGR